MDTMLITVYQNYDLYLLIFLRVLGFIIISPIFGRKNVPLYSKIGLSLLIAYMIMTVYTNNNQPVMVSFFDIFHYMSKELIVGMAIGYITTLTFSALLTAGQIIDTQVGFGIANVLDPQMNIQIPLLGNFKSILALLIFFAVNGDHTLLLLLSNSYDVLPAGSAWFSPTLSPMVNTIFVRVFVLAYKIALPIIAAAFLGEMALGLMVRTVPQMNVFVIGIPLKIIIGLIALYLFLPIYIGFLNNIFSAMFEDIHMIFEELVPK